MQGQKRAEIEKRQTDMTAHFQKMTEEQSARQQKEAAKVYARAARITTALAIIASFSARG